MAAIGLLPFAGILSGASFLAYITIHELKSKSVKQIEKRRLKKVREHLTELSKKSTKSGAITTEIEGEFQNLFDEEYSEAYAPRNALRMLDLAFLLSTIAFFVAAFLDWANSNPNVSALAGVGLTSLEGEMFILGVFLLAVGIFELERLRRMGDEEEDIDPAPFLAIIGLGMIVSINTYLLFSLGTTLSNLTSFGKVLFVSFFLSYPGIIISFTSWEKEDWRRAFGVLLMAVPYILLFAVSILVALNFPIG